MNKELITRAFETLGPERVQRGLTGERATSRSCFLARAYGPDGALEDCARRLAGSERLVVSWGFFGLPLGLTAGEAAEVAHAFDRPEGEFRALAEEWLEQNRVVQETCAAVSAERETDTVSVA